MAVTDFWTSADYDESTGTIVFDTATPATDYTVPTVTYTTPPQPDPRIVELEQEVEQLKQHMLDLIDLVDMIRHG